MNFLTEETCPGPRLCVPFEQCAIEREALPRDGRGQAVQSEELDDWIRKWKIGGRTPLQYGYQDDGFYWCTYCRRIRRPDLVQCPSCSQYFKGPKPNMSIDYECSECE